MNCEFCGEREGKRVKVTAKIGSEEIVEFIVLCLDCRGELKCIKN